ncbi:TetR/AcrR family transcriptional regulator [Sphingomonas sp. PP-CC-3G-468]|uniref:TetR/AcrR family transcriptional regulator n=1 Tax=Sphingomonas sp. PP-CC-3G-468 TaxID=2135656 RepID=UPI001042E0F3|nr:TetR/AcrR family transcriptional regulator [Sphingomonas sp. PP-CC-3G-468]TCM07442.1 TetR family transcriptional regulator [Sphingomonas sp. PP-CC-3G-468]
MARPTSDAQHDQPMQSVPSRLGRKRDSSRDGAILEAAIEILGDTGYDRMTMEMVAVRARAGKGTVYRRWSSKQEMLLDAVARMKAEEVDLGRMPDTGSLRGDMLALFQPQSVEQTDRKLRAMAGLATLLAQEPALADAASDAISSPWTQANRTLLERAVERGEVASDAPIATLATIIPSLGAHRTLVQRKPFDQAFLVEMLDCVLLPAAGVRPTAD